MKKTICIILVAIILSQVCAYDSPDKSLSEMVEKRLGDIKKNPILTHLHKEFQNRYDEIVQRLHVHKGNNSESDKVINFKIDTMGLLVDIYDAANETSRGRA